MKATEDQHYSENETVLTEIVNPLEFTGKEQQKPFWEDKVALSNLDNNLNYCKKLIQDSVDEFRKVWKNDQSITLKELQSCLTPERQRAPKIDIIENLLREKVLDSQKERFLGLQLDRNKLLDLLVLPDYTGFLESLEQFSRMISYKIFDTRNWDVVFWQCFSMDNNKVKLNVKEVERIKGTHRQFISNEIEEERLKQVQNLCQALNGVIKTGCSISGEEFKISRNLINYEEGQFSPSYVFVKLGRIR